MTNIINYERTERNLKFAILRACGFKIFQIFDIMDFEDENNSNIFGEIEIKTYIDDYTENEYVNYITVESENTYICLVDFNILQSKYCDEQINYYMNDIQYYCCEDIKTYGIIGLIIDSDCERQLDKLAMDLRNIYNTNKQFNNFLKEYYNK